MSRLQPVDLHTLAAHAPLYVELRAQLRRFLTETSDVSRLPPERMLAKAYGVSRITVRKALQGLREEGLIASLQGHGTVVQIKRAPEYGSR